MDVFHIADGQRLYLRRVALRDVFKTVAEADNFVALIDALDGGRRDNTVQAGRGTAADEVLRLAGTVNAVDGFDGYKPLSDEAVIAAAPEAIVVMEQGGQPAGEILAFPSLAPTPAAIAGRMIAMDGNYLLGFGPRAPEAIAALRARLYPGIVFPPLEPGQ